MKTTKLAVALGSVALFGTVGAAQTATTNFFLSGDQEVAPVDTIALGAAQFTYDFGTQTFDLDMMVFGLSLDDLLGVGPNESPVHIHLAPVGANGGIVIDLGVVGSFSEDGLGIRYTISDQLLGGNTGAIFSDVATNEAALGAGNLYINIHTNENPGGELRGQISGIPSPATVALLGLGGLVAARRRRG